MLKQKHPHILTKPNELASSTHYSMWGTFLSLSSHYKEYGGDMASTWVAKPLVHVEVVEFLLNPVTTVIVANDDNYALAA